MDDRDTIAQRRLREDWEQVARHWFALRSQGKLTDEQKTILMNRADQLIDGWGTMELERLVMR